MINRTNCNLKLSKLKLLTASAWRGSYLSHNSIFKEQQSVSTQNSYAQTSNPISHLGNKKPSADLLSFNSAAQIRVLGCGDYLNRTDCQLWFLFFSLLRFVGEGRTNYQERFNTQDFSKIFLECSSSNEIRVFCWFVSDTWKIPLTPEVFLTHISTLNPRELNSKMLV